MTFTNLPHAVAAYIRATNAFDLESLLQTFVDDAIVNDQLKAYWGQAAIKTWAAHDIIGDKVTMDVVDAVERYGNCIVTANVDGNFDKRGLEDPFVLTFYFSLFQDKIVQLIILRERP